MGPVARRWHANVGLVVAAFLLVVSVTGVVLTFRHQIKTPEPVAEGTASGPVLTMEGAIAAARTHAGAAVAPDVSVAELYLANDPEGTWCVVFADAVATEVYMAADGALLSVVVPKKGLTQWMFDLHTGEILGPAGTWLSAGMGLSLVWLTLSGVWLKVPRRWKARASAAAAK